jgi:hypothetical protein
MLFRWCRRFLRLRRCRLSSETSSRVPTTATHRNIPEIGILTILTDRPTIQPYGVQHYSRGHQLCSQSIASQQIMEPEVSLLHSEELSTCTYPEPDQTSPYHPSLSPRSILILCTALHCLPGGVFSINNIYTFHF